MLSKIFMERIKFMQVQRVQNNPQQFTGVSYSFP